VKSSAWGGWSGTIENVIVRVPGTSASTRDVLITAHYDSVPVGPGAGDDGVAVASMLETMRALEAGPPLKNDVVFLFTDGEEMGWLGAKAFVKRHPEMGDVGVAFAFEGWPESGPTEMRATSPGDAWLVRQLATASPPVWAGSQTNSDEERLYHGSDFGVLAGGGLLGAEFENSGKATLQHTPRDTVEAVDPGIVQDHGDTMLTLARHFGDLDLREAHKSSEDLVFFTVPGVGFVAYPTWLSRVLSIVAVVLLLGLLVIARRREELTLGRLALGTLAFLALLLGSFGLSVGVWELLISVHPHANELTYPDFEGSTVAIVTIYAVVAIAFIAFMYAVSPRIGVIELAAGALLWWAVADLTLGLFAPLSSALASLPLLGGIVALAVVTFLRGPWAATLLALAAVPALLLFVPLLVLQAHQPDDGAGVAVLALMVLLGLLVPQLALITGQLQIDAKV
jgi:hypothetical protein